MVAVSPSATVLDAAMMMNAWRVGAVVVKEGERLAGIFTERDVLRRVVAAGRDPARTRVSEVMSVDVICCQPDTTVEEARAIFKTKRVRHLPVLAVDGQLHGVVSIGDLNAWSLRGQEVEIRYLKEYLYGPA